MDENYRKISVKIIARNEGTGDETSQKIAGGMPERSTEHREYNLDAFGNREQLIRELAKKIAINSFVCAFDLIDGSFNGSKQQISDYKNFLTLLDEQKTPTK